MDLIISMKNYRKKSYIKEKVVLLNTRQVFENAVAANKELNLNHLSSNILEVCRGEVKSAGKINRVPLIWVFYKDYINMSEDQIKRKLKQSNNKPVRCINTGEIFIYIADAGRKYNVDPQCISRACIGKQKTAGSHPETNERLLWEFIDK